MTTRDERSRVDLRDERSRVNPSDEIPAVGALHAVDTQGRASIARQAVSVLYTAVLTPTVSTIAFDVAFPVNKSLVPCYLCVPERSRGPK